MSTIPSLKSLVACTALSSAIYAPVISAQEREINQIYNPITVVVQINDKQQVVHSPKHCTEIISKNDFFDKSLMYFDCKNDVDPEVTTGDYTLGTFPIAKVEAYLTVNDIDIGSVCDYENKDNSEPYVVVSLREQFYPPETQFYNIHYFSCLTPSEAQVARDGPVSVHEQIEILNMFNNFIRDVNAMTFYEDDEPLFSSFEEVREVVQAMAFESE